jgi:hypothetical protein
VFSRSDTATDSERFYDSVLDLFEDIEEREEVEDLMIWWNRFVFPLKLMVRELTTSELAIYSQITHVLNDRRQKTARLQGSRRRERR